METLCHWVTAMHLENSDRALQKPSTNQVEKQQFPLSIDTLRNSLLC